MKPSGILLFILGTFCLLGILSYTFPDDGIRVKDAVLEFPSLDDMLSDSEIRTLSEEELEDIRTSLLQKHEASRFDWLTDGSDSTLFRFPDNDPSCWDNFFGSLEVSHMIPMRIVHYGDSQIEMDRITCVYRDSLQRRFGGLGVGMVPLRMPFYTMTLGQYCSDSLLSRSQVFGEKDFSVQKGMYGPMGQAVRATPGLSVTYFTAKYFDEDSPSRKIGRVRVLALEDSLEIRSDKLVAEKDMVGPMVRYTFDAPDSLGRVRLNFPKGGTIYGVSLEGDGGISVDNIAMRGCSGSIFTLMNKAQLSSWFAATNTRLVILQYGGNSMPYIKSEKQISTYGQKMEEQIRLIREVAPKAAVLFIGPSDMSTNIGGKMQTYPHLPQFVDTLRTRVNAAGAAYWDMYRVMGGLNSMPTWVKTGMAGSDYVHFSKSGAAFIGEALYDKFSAYYDYYLWRREHKSAAK